MPSLLLDLALQRAAGKVRSNLPRWRGRFPTAASVKGRYGVYSQDAIVEGEAWTGGFWPGLLWLAYEISDDDAVRRGALDYVEVMAERLDRKIWLDHHDLGFLYSLTCVPAHRLAGSPRAGDVALAAAEALLQRYQPRGRFIQAWGVVGDPREHRLIVDALMNLPLLFWAARRTGEARFREAAEAHLATTLQTAIRPDGSTFHTFYFDPATGRPSHGVTRQGWSDASCWARGQAWTVYGLALAYRHTRQPGLPAEFRRVAEYFLGRLPEDGVCYWDLAFTSGPQERDSSAAAIAACGFLEAAEVFPEGPDRDRWEREARRIVASLSDGYLAPDDQDGLLAHGVYSKPDAKGVDECCIWGDYFYLEALRRLQGDWAPYW